MPLVTLFAGDKHDAFPARTLDVDDLQGQFEAWSEFAPGVEKGGNGFACYVHMRPGTDVSIAELNLQRAKEGKPALARAAESIVRERGYRNYAHIQEVTAIVIDYDEQPTVPPDWRAESWPCDVYAHSTHSYDPETLPGKWRVVLPLAEPLPIGLEGAFRKVLQEYLPPGCIVRAPHQPAYLPTCPAGGTVEVVHVTQTEIPAALDWRVFVSASTPEVVHATGEAGGTLLGAEFDRRGLVRRDLGHKLDVVCPWASEHASGDDLGFLYFTEDGLGKFGCGHTACAAARRGSPAVFELWGLGGTPAQPEALPAPAIGLPAAAPRATFELMTADDMSAVDEALPWVVRDLISVGEPTLFVGGAGAGKTSAIVSMALSVATGRPVWGLYQVERPGPVVHIDYEQGKTLRRTYRAFARGLDTDAAALVRAGLLRVAPLPREQLLDLNVTDKHLSLVGSDLVKLCTGASLCVVNSLTAGTNKVSENDAKIAAVFNLLARVTEITGCAMVVLHHSGRGEGVRARGSSAIDGAVQTTFQIDSRHAKTQNYTSWEHVKDRPAGGFASPFELHWTNVEGVQRLAAKLPEPEPEEMPGAERPEDRIEKAILWLMVEANLTQKTRILERVRGKADLKFRVWDDMVVKTTITALGSRWKVSPGVVPPREQPPGARNEGD